MVATPARWLSTPVSSMERDGEHRGEVRYEVNMAPDRASRSMLGVRASPPKAPKSIKAASSTRMTTILGRLAATAGVAACARAMGAWPRPTRQARPRAARRWPRVRRMNPP